MTETELRWVIKGDESGEPLPMMQWAVVRRTLKPFLRNTGQQGQEERLDFFHASISQVSNVKQPSEILALHAVLISLMCIWSVLSYIYL